MKEGHRTINGTFVLESADTEFEISAKILLREGER
jgi:hypothetical protein